VDLADRREAVVLDRGITRRFDLANERLHEYHIRVIAANREGSYAQFKPEAA
jgi:hypothetical protein